MTPSATPTPTPTARVLQLGMDGTDVKDMQLRLSQTSCGSVDRTIATGYFDWWTQTVLGQYQRSYKIKERPPRAAARSTGRRPGRLWRAPRGLLTPGRRPGRAVSP